MVEDCTEKVNPSFSTTAQENSIQYHWVAKEKDSSTSLAWIRAPVSSVTDWDTDHYTTRDSFECLKIVPKK